MSAKVEAPSEKSYPILPVLIVLTLIIGVIWAMIAPGFTIPSDFRAEHFLIGLLFVYLGFLVFNLAFILLAAGIGWLTGSRRFAATLGSFRVARFDFGKNLQINIGLVPIGSYIELQPEEHPSRPPPTQAIASALTMLLLLVIGAVIYRGNWLAAITSIPGNMIGFVQGFGGPWWTAILLTAADQGSWLNLVGLLFIKLSVLNFVPLPGFAGGRLVYLLASMVNANWAWKTARSNWVRNFLLLLIPIFVLVLTQLFYELAVVARSFL